MAIISDDFVEWLLNLPSIRKIFVIFLMIVGMMICIPICFDNLVYIIQYENQLDARTIFLLYNLKLVVMFVVYSIYILILGVVVEEELYNKEVA